MNVKFTQAQAVQAEQWIEVKDAAGKWGWHQVQVKNDFTEQKTTFILDDGGEVEVFPTELFLTTDDDPTGVPNRHDVPSWDDYFLGFAQAASRRAKCRRRSVGAVVVDEGHRIISTGYNGFPPGTQGDCLTGACPRGLTKKGDIPPDSPYTDPQAPGFCPALHAEINCLLHLSGKDSRDATMYVTDRPCPDCMRLVAGAGIKRVVWPEGEMNPMDFYKPAQEDA